MMSHQKYRCGNFGTSWRQVVEQTDARRTLRPRFSLTPEAIVVVDQLWDYFDRTGEQELEGEHDYDFQVEGDRLLVLPKDSSDRVVGIDLDGRVESTFEPERFEHLMERFAIVYAQISAAQYQQNNQDRERG